ncbi:hypothetical protein BHE74_00041005 [Ensete ventricosum]|nr:hypothetical protein BHE74_00041005 [Ensete ventricosum]
MEIRPSWEEALAFPAGKKAGELEVDEEDIEEKDVESCCSKDWWDERLDSSSQPMLDLDEESWPSLP